MSKLNVDQKTIFDLFSDKKEESVKDFVSYICKDIVPNNRRAEDTCFDNLYESIDDVEYHNIFTSSIKDGLRKDILDIIN